MSRRIRTFSSNHTLVSDRRKQIIKCATKVFMKQGFDRCSVRELSQACGMSVGALYYYVGSKEDIIYLIFDVLTGSYVDLHKDLDGLANCADTMCILRESIKRFLEHVDDFQDAYNFANHVILNTKRSDRQPLYDAYEAQIQYFETLLKKGVDAGEFDIDNAKIVACDIAAVCINWVYRRWFLRKHFSLEEYIRKQTELILRAIRVDKHADGNDQDS